MQINWYTHLPAVKADFADSFILTHGHLRFLDFDTWQRLDGTFPFQNRRYESNRPLFYTSSLNGIETFEEAVDQIQSINLSLYYSFLLLSGTRLLPNPQMSCTYMEKQDGRMRYYQRLIGNFEREWILFGGSWNYNYTEEQLQEIGNYFNFLVSVKDFSDNYTIMQGLRTLQFTSNPEFCFKNNRLDYFNGFIHCMSLLESALVPVFVRKNYNLTITEAFGRAASVIMSQAFSETKSLATYFSETYRVRSKIIHGEASSTNITGSVEDAFIIIRSLLCKTIDTLIKLHNIGFQTENLSSLMLKACEDEKTYDEFKNLF
jgi:hypothetical protein